MHHNIFIYSGTFNPSEITIQKLTFCASVSNTEIICIWQHIPYRVPSIHIRVCSRCSLSKTENIRLVYICMLFFGSDDWVHAWFRMEWKATEFITFNCGVTVANWAFQVPSSFIIVACVLVNLFHVSFWKVFRCGAHCVLFHIHLLDASSPG